METKKLTSRQKKALETEKAIFESAITLFKEKGFDNVHIDEITSKAGTSKGSFYTYFKSKDEVIIEHYKRIDEHYQEVYLNLPAEMPSIKKLYTILIEGILFLEKFGHEFLSVVLSNQLSPNSESSFVMNQKRIIYKITKELLESGQKNLEFKNQAEPITLASMLLCFYKGLYLDWCLLKGKYNFIERSEKELTIFLYQLLELDHEIELNIK